MGIDMTMVQEMISKISSRNPLKLKNGKVTAYRQQLGYLFEDVLWEVFKELNMGLKRKHMCYSLNHRYHYGPIIDYYDEENDVMYDAKLNAAAFKEFSAIRTIVDRKPAKYVIVHIWPRSYSPKRDEYIFKERSHYTYINKDVWAFVNADYYFNQVKYRGDLMLLYHFIKEETRK